MIKALWQYLHKEVLSRSRPILCGSELWLALLLSAWFGWCGPQGVVAAAKVVDLVGGLLTYASVAFGFALAGLTLALTLPDRDFAKRLAADHAERPTTAYSDLLFVFSWTALWHWIMIVVLVAALIVCGPDELVIPAAVSHGRRAVLALGAFVVTYGILQFLITVITLSQVGDAYIKSLRSSHQ